MQNSKPSHMQTLERAMAVGGRLVEETEYPHLVITDDNAHYRVVAADQFSEVMEGGGPALIVAHLN